MEPKNKFENLIIHIMGGGSLLCLGGFLIAAGMWPFVIIIWGVGFGAPLTVKIALKILNSNNNIKSKNKFNNEGDIIYPEKYKKQDLSRYKANTQRRYEYERELLNPMEEQLGVIHKQKVLTLTKNKKSIDK